jgi:uncharacterized LabA/DUF88 family protein
MIRVSRRFNCKFASHHQLQLRKISDDKISIAVLIDGDNVRPQLFSNYISETAKYGKASVRRCYGDWSVKALNSWKDEINSLAIRPIQKFAYTTKKNSTDTELIIDAMDLLHSKRVQGFCIVSSDSDYTGLALRIREEGLFVMGIGDEKTPRAFVTACEVFTFTEQLVNERLMTKIGDFNAIKLVRDVFMIFDTVVNASTGRVRMSTLEYCLIRDDHTFDICNYGFASLVDFCNKLLLPTHKVFFERSISYLESVDMAKRGNQSSIIVKSKSTGDGKAAEELNCVSQIAGISNDETDSVQLSTVSDANKKILLKVVSKIFKEFANVKTGRLELGHFGQVLRLNDPFFDVKKYGFTTFKTFCEILLPTFRVCFDHVKAATYLERSDNKNSRFEISLVDQKELLKIVSTIILKEFASKSADTTDKQRVPLNILGAALRNNPPFDMRKYGFTSVKGLCEVLRPTFRVVTEDTTAYLEKADAVLVDNPAKVVEGGGESA